MKEIVAENVKMIYLFPDTEATDLVASVSSELSPYYLKLGKKIDTRLAQFENFMRQFYSVPYVLFWNDGSDLVKLDHAVREDAYTDDDFKRSIKTIVQITKCFQCSREYPTLVVPTGDPYLGNQGLMERKLKTYSILECPNCKSSFRQLVVKILSE